MANKIGKKLQCSNCGSEFVVTKSGEGEVNCCGKPMKEKKEVK